MGAPAGVYGVPLARLPLGWDRNFAVPLLNCDAGSHLQGLGVSVGFFFAANARQLVSSPISSCTDTLFECLTIGNGERRAIEFDKLAAFEIAQRARDTFTGGANKFGDFLMS